jgi:hypothetical protein
LVKARAQPLELQEAKLSVVAAGGAEDDGARRHACTPLRQRRAYRRANARHGHMHARPGRQRRLGVGHVEPALLLSFWVGAFPRIVARGETSLPNLHKYSTSTDTVLPLRDDLAR